MREALPIPLPIEQPTLRQQQIQNRSEIANLQGELHELIMRVNEVKAELSTRWETDRQIDLTLMESPAV